VESVDLLLRFQRQVIEYFTGKPTRFTVRVDFSGVPAFRQAVLEACRRIPYGQTASYADLARAAGSPGAARAAGTTMANNPLPLVIPCHRVLRADGSIGGFSTPQGVKQKKRLLRLENALSYVSPV
jgi:methylated-DNA-[protein]-cysteine S-methyltransferase